MHSVWDRHSLLMIRKKFDVVIWDKKIRAIQELSKLELCVILL